jgi:hypothetical protein
LAQETAVHRWDAQSAHGREIETNGEDPLLARFAALADLD